MEGEKREVGASARVYVLLTSHRAKDAVCLLFSLTGFLINPAMLLSVRYQTSLSLTSFS